MSINWGIIERLKAVLKEREMSQKEFGRLTDISPAMIGHLFHGRVAFTTERVIAVCSALDLSPSWLLTGRYDSPNAQTLITPDLVSIPMFNVAASCGNGTRCESATLVKMIEINRPWVNKNCGTANIKALNIISVDGDSMAPTMTDGDFVIVDISANRVYADALFAFMKNDDLYIKRIQRNGSSLRIISDNPTYKEWEVNPADESEQFRVIGRVVTICHILPV